MHTQFWLKNRKGTDHSEDVDEDGMIILQWMFKEIGWDVNWIHVSQDRYRWWAVVNTVMNLWAP